MTSTDLINQQASLQSRAHEVVKELQLDTHLSQLGQFKIDPPTEIC